MYRPTITKPPPRLTLGDLKEGDATIMVQCRGYGIKTCGHEEPFRARDVKSNTHDQTPIERLPFKCKVCGARMFMWGWPRR